MELGSAAWPSVGKEISCNLVLAEDPMGQYLETCYVKINIIISSCYQISRKLGYKAMLIPWITGPRNAHLSGVLHFQIGNLPRFRKEVYKLGITDGITSHEQCMPWGRK